MTFRYDFRAADGRVCCQGDNFNHLCATCKGRARLRPPGIPEPPSLADAIRRARATQHITIAESKARARQYYLDAPRPMSTGRLP